MTGLTKIATPAICRGSGFCETAQLLAGKWQGPG
jgi:hypothetical protein